MAPLDGSTAMSSSPHSIDETTNHGTPSTNFTTFTPEAASAVKARVAGSAPRPAPLRPVRPYQASVSEGSDEDVFLTAPPVANRPQLSPTADVFTPRLPRAMVMEGERAANAGTSMPVKHYAPLSQLPSDYVYLPNGYPTYVGANTEEAVHRNSYGPMSFKPSTLVNPVPRSYARDINFREGTFSSDNSDYRAFVVMGGPLAVPTSVIAAKHFNADRLPSLKTIRPTIMHCGYFTIRCSDIRDANQALKAVDAVLPFSTIHPLSAKKFAEENGDNPALVSDYEGQIKINIHFSIGGGASPVKAASIVGELRSLLVQCGGFRAFHTLPMVKPGSLEILVEMYDTDHVAAVCNILNGCVIKGCVIGAEPHMPDVFPPLDELAEAVEKISITGRSTVPVNDGSALIARAIQHDMPFRGRRVAQNLNHNAVVISRILSGADVRTTIMLRNIPNKVDQAMLKDFIDLTSKGRYDFTYLRIDFANNCNVGYAFINFIDAQFVVPFVDARAGKRWNCFNSDKVAEVSYATIQGKDCLVQKFRNSSVMLEHPQFRPKLFIAGDGPRAGEEEPFPGPDNHSKMRRSVENAEHVGLYIPKRRLHDPWFPDTEPETHALPHGRTLRRTGKFQLCDDRRRGLYLPPARAARPIPQEMPELARDPAPCRYIPFTVDINSPTDPFAGRPFAGPFVRS